MPSPFATPTGCAFAPRCPFADAPLPRGRAAAARARRRTSLGLLEGAARPRRADDAPRRGGRMSDTAPLLRVERLAKHFVVRRGAARSRRRRRARGRRRRPRARRRRDARRRRRVGLRQVDARPARAAADRADVGPRRVRRPRPRDAVAVGVARAAPRDADHLPGPVRVAEPAHDRRRRRSPSRSCCTACTPAAARRASRSCSTPSASRPSHARPLSARVLRRPAPAHRHRARARGRAEADRLRRGGVGARRVGAGAGRQPADGPAAPPRPRVPVHRARPRGRQAHRDADRGDVPRPHRRDRAEATRCSPSRAIRTRRRCSPRFRCPTPTRGASGRCSAATCRARSTRRRAAASARAARTRASVAPSTSRRSRPTPPDTRRPATSGARFARTRRRRGVPPGRRRSSASNDYRPRSSRPPGPSSRDRWSTRPRAVPPLPSRRDGRPVTSSGEPSMTSVRLVRGLALACGLLASLSPVPSFAQAPRTLRVGLAEDPDVLDPTLARSFVGRVVFAALCDKLVDIDEKLAIVPQLATSWDWSRRQQDADDEAAAERRRSTTARSFDAAAVKFNIERHKTMAGSNRRGELAPVATRRRRRSADRPLQPLDAVLAAARAARRPRRHDGVAEGRAGRRRPLRHEAGVLPGRSGSSSASRRTASCSSASRSTGTSDAIHFDKHRLHADHRRDRAPREPAVGTARLHRARRRRATSRRSRRTRS